MFYGPYTGQHHGGDGGQMHKVRLYESDKIVKVTGRRGIGPGAGVDQLTFHTSRYGIIKFRFSFRLLLVNYQIRYGSNVHIRVSSSSPTNNYL